ncbi:hypothetical protein HRH25_05815 [Flavisolibacter sp. BT320]|nr:hypothetical protein [Flavisolibacter longurius]
MTTSRLLFLCLALMVFVSCEKDPTELPANNKTPVASAGPDHTIMRPKDNIILSGNISHDSDGFIASYEWQTVAGPNSPNMDKSRVLMAGLEPSQMFVSNLEEGVYQFELLVTDNDKAVSRDTVKVTVLPDSLTRDPSKMKRFDYLWWEDACTIRISNISSTIPATGSFQVFMASYAGGGPMSGYVASSGWYLIQPARSAGFWYEITNDVLIIHAPANINCDWDDAVYDVLIRWN